MTEKENKKSPQENNNVNTDDKQKEKKNNWKKYIIYFLITFIITFIIVIWFYYLFFKSFQLSVYIIFFISYSIALIFFIISWLVDITEKEEDVKDILFKYFKWDYFKNIMIISIVIWYLYQFIFLQNYHALYFFSLTYSISLYIILLSFIFIIALWIGYILYQLLIEYYNNNKFLSYIFFLIIAIYFVLLWILIDKLSTNLYYLFFIFIYFWMVAWFILFLFLWLIIGESKNKFIFKISIIFILIPIFWWIGIFIYLPEYKNTIYWNWKVSINWWTWYNNIKYMNDSYVIYESWYKTFTKKITDDMVFCNLDDLDNKNNKKSSTTTWNKESSQKCECKCK